MNQLFSTSDLLTLIPSITLIVLSVGLFGGKGKVLSAFRSLKSFLFLLAVLFLVSCGKHEAYSPLDSYIKATNESYYANIKAENEAKHFIDSLNNNHK